MSKLNLESYLNEHTDISTEDIEDKSTENHTLFFDEDADIKNFRLFLEGIGLEGTKIHKVLNILLNAGPQDTMEMRIQSPGGMIDEGMRLLNVFESKFKGRVTAYIDNTAKSMAAILFCSADKRIVFRKSEIMFHNYSGGAIGKGDEITSKVDHTNSHIAKLYKTYTIDKGFFSEEELSRLFDGKDYWFNAEEMLRRNIATHISIDGKEYTAEEYLTNIINT